jgi:hypothetical protein
VCRFIATNLQMALPAHHKNRLSLFNQRMATLNKEFLSWATGQNQQAPDGCLGGGMQVGGVTANVCTRRNT